MAASARPICSTRDDIIVDGPVVEALAESEQRAVDHMNDDHLDAIANYARHFAKADGGGWVMTGIDVDGIDLAAGDESRRVFFPSPLKDAQEHADGAGRDGEGGPGGS